MTKGIILVLLVMVFTLLFVSCHDTTGEQSSSQMIGNETLGQDSSDSSNQADNTIEQDWLDEEYLRVYRYLMDAQYDIKNVDLLVDKLRGLTYTDIGKIPNMITDGGGLGFAFEFPDKTVTYLFDDGNTLWVTIGDDEPIVYTLETDVYDSIYYNDWTNGIEQQREYYNVPQPWICFPYAIFRYDNKGAKTQIMDERDILTLMEMLPLLNYSKTETEMLPDRVSDESDFGFDLDYDDKKIKYRFTGGNTLVLTVGEEKPISYVIASAMYEGLEFFHWHEEEPLQTTATTTTTP